MNASNNYLAQVGDMLAHELDDTIETAKEQAARVEAMKRLASSDLVDF